ncbi:glycosyltransferase family 33 protein [Panus rudis PR-1116 ss-1]|nr:glycosyltransferase family 33 protein [Panus rudis PR-1116 ss-1]
MPSIADLKVILQLLVVLFFCYSIWYLITRPKRRPALRSVAILVLGDIGRSPRMMYHAESFAENEFETYLIGNKGSKPIPSLMSIPHVHFLYLPNPPKPHGLPFIIAGPRKVIHQVFSILDALLYRMPKPPEFILVQNPPSIPTLALVWLVSKIRGSKVIIDWHNLGYSILALKLGDNHPFVRVAKWFESYFGRDAYAHLFVTDAMREHLSKEWHLQGRKIVLHDRPPAHFHRATPQEMHDLFLRLYPALKPATFESFFPPSDPPYSTPFTKVSPPPNPELDIDFGGDGASMVPIQRQDRPALVVSSTSWTEDEDFSILLDALSMYEVKARERNEHPGSREDELPKLLMVVTGKGPLKDKYMREVDRLQSGRDGKNGLGGWRWVRCVSMWLEPQDYPMLLGSADLGISLHSSSSNLDLPMKVVDMFGCGLPVCALDFSCLHELVKEGTNGLIFHNAQELSSQLDSLFTCFPSSSPTAPLNSLRASLVESRNGRGAVSSNWEWGSWTENWNRIMRPVVLKDVRFDEGQN